MGSGASALPERAGLIVEPPKLEREEYIKEHHKFFDAFTKHQWTEVYQYVASQTSKGALAALGEANFQNCLRISIGAVGYTQESPKDIDLAVAVLCRCCEVAQWSPAKAAEFLMDHPKKHEVLQAFLKAALPDFVGASPREQVDRLMEVIDDKAKHYGCIVLSVARACLAENEEAKALALLDKYLKQHRPADPYDAGDLLALWYALQWRKSGKGPPKAIGKVAIVLFKSHHMKVLVDDAGTEFDGGITSWDEKILRSETVPMIERDWRLFSDAMCFLTDGAFGIEPLIVECCWDVLTKAFHPIWDSKYNRCISQTNFGVEEFTTALRKWEEDYKEANGGESDVMLFHLLFPAGTPNVKANVTKGGIDCSTLRHSIFQGRPVYQDEGLAWTHHHRVFWMFHETHHLYETHFQDRLDFAELIKKTDHPMFQMDNWMEEFKGGNDFFPGEHWLGCSEFDWYVQSITRRLNGLKEPSFGEYWASWWGGKEEEKAGAYYDFVSEHHILWEAGSKENWEKALEVIDSQLRPMCCKKLGEANYKNVVIFAIRALTLTGKALDGPVLAALRGGMEVLEWPEARAGELISNIPGDQRIELLQLYQKSEKGQEKPRQKLKKQGSLAISILDDHQQMWNAFVAERWEEVLEHIDTQVTSMARERLGDANFTNCFVMSFTAIGKGKGSPNDVEDAIKLLQKGIELTGWPLSTFAGLLNNHPKKSKVLQHYDEEGEHYDFISEHHILWEAGVKEDWEKICEVIDSQLRPMSLKRLGEQNYRNVVTIGVRGLMYGGRALEGPVLEALQKGMKVLDYPKDRAKELVNGIPPDQETELLRMFSEA